MASYIGLNFDGLKQLGVSIRVLPRDGETEESYRSRLVDHALKSKDLRTAAELEIDRSTGNKGLDIALILDGVRRLKDKQKDDVNSNHTSVLIGLKDDYKSPLRPEIAKYYETPESILEIDGKKIAYHIENINSNNKTYVRGYLVAGSEREANGRIFMKAEHVYDSSDRKIIARALHQKGFSRVVFNEA